MQPFYLFNINIHPTINIFNQDPACDLDYNSKEARNLKITHALSNSFGFGGTNGSLIFQNIRSERVKKSKFNIFINTKKVSINDRSFLYGDGLFETILVRDGKIYYLKDHYSRLKKGSKLLKILIPDFNRIINKKMY